MIVTTDTSDLWTCPKCGKRYVTRNMYHSCGRHTVDEFLAGKGPAALAYWERFKAMVGRCGPYDLFANKGQIGFMVRVRFAGVGSLSERGMTIEFWLKEKVESPRFTRVQYLERRDWIYKLRVKSLEEMDDELQQWLCEAYQVGCQRA